MWINTKLNKIYITENEIFLDFPNISFPQPGSDDIFAKLHVFRITKKDPEYDKKTQKIDGYTINQCEDGKYIQEWKIIQMSDEERLSVEKDQMNKVRSQCKTLLYQSDWTQLSDNKLTSEQQEAWKIYRQHVRDVSTQPGFPWLIEWPNQPK